MSFDLLVLRASDSVVGLLIDETNDRVLLVRQLRAPMVREDNLDGAITELTAGRFDVKLGPKALLVKEAREEAGVTLTEEEIELVNLGEPMALSAGILTERCFGGFAIIHPDRIDESNEGNLPTDDKAGREGLIGILNTAWFAKAFCGNNPTVLQLNDMDRIWKYVLNFQLYDQLAVLASVPELAEIHFNPYIYIGPTGAIIKSIGTTKVAGSRTNLKNPEQTAKALIDVMLAGLTL